MAANGNLIFQDTNKATFVGANSNVVIDTVHASFGVGVDVNGPTSNLHVVGNCFVSTDFTASTLSGNGSGLTALNAANVTTGTLAVTRGGTGTTTSTGTGSVVLSDAPTFTGDVTFDTNTLFVDSVNDRVGIGTTDPNENLEIYGDGIRIHDPDSSPKIDFVRGGASRNPNTQTFGLSDYSDWRITANGPSLNFQNQYTGGNSGNLINVMTLKHNTGNVGIGTDSPDCNLEIYGDTSSIKLTRSRNNTNFGCSVDFALLNSANEKFTYGRLSGSIADNTDGSEDGFLSFQVGTNGNLQNNYQEEKMRILSNGNVGIGTSTPRTNLHIGQQLNSQGDKNTIPSAGLGISANFPSTTHAWFSNRVNATGDEYWGLAVGTIYDGASYLQNLNKNTVTYYNLLLQPNGGNVGIGKTDPGAKLDVNGSIRGAYNTNTTSYFGRSAVGYVGHNDWAGFAHLDRNSLDDYALLQNSAGRTILNSKSDQRISFSSGDQETMCVKGSNVGIGTSSPDSTLDVHGTGIHINGTVLRSYSGMGAMTGGQWYKVCDFSALPATVLGVCAIRIKWGGGTLTNVGTYYWSGHASGIVPYNTYGDGNGTYTAAPTEPLTLNQIYHHRAAGAFEFILDGDGSGGSYGRQSIYIKTPQSLSDLSLEVIALPLRR